MNPKLPSRPDRFGSNRWSLRSGPARFRRPSAGRVPGSRQSGLPAV